MDDHAAESKPAETLLEWSEPEIRELDMSETALNQGVGGDGGTFAMDCTLS